MNTYARKDWSELTHAYGSAEDVPNSLADLNSQDEQVRENASSELFATIWHQGTVYPATVKALPELVTLFKSLTCADRDLVAVLLASIASGDGYYHVHTQLDGLEQPLKKVYGSAAPQ